MSPPPLKLNSDMTMVRSAFRAMCHTAAAAAAAATTHPNTGCVRRKKHKRCSFFFQQNSNLAALCQRVLDSSRTQLWKKDDLSAASAPFVRRTLSPTSRGRDTSNTTSSSASWGQRAIRSDLHCEKSSTVPLRGSREARRIAPGGGQQELCKVEDRKDITCHVGFCRRRGSRRREERH